MTTMPSSCFFSLESSWAFFGAFQTAGSSREALTVLRRSDLASKSKIPPERLRARGEIGQLRADQVDAFCVHVVVVREKADFRTRPYRRLEQVRPDVAQPDWRDDPWSSIKIALASLREEAKYAAVTKPI
jgi:hypothetical protein